MSSREYEEGAAGTKADRKKAKQGSFIKKR
jgi:hypothetical protein